MIRSFGENIYAGKTNILRAEVDKVKIKFNINLDQKQKKIRIKSSIFLMA